MSDPYGPDPRDAEIARLRAELAEAQAAPEPEDRIEDAPPEPTHKLGLADGRVIDHYGAIPTHYSDDNGVTPVVRAWEVNPGG